MKKNLSFALAGISVVVCLLASCVSSPSAKAAAPKDRPGVVVFDFTVKSADTADSSLGSDVAQAITEALLHGTSLKPVERSALDKIMAEQEFSLSGMVKDEDALKIGSLSGAHFILLGSISVVADQLRINARMLDVETSEIVLADSVYGKKADVFALESQIAKKIEAGVK